MNTTTFAPLPTPTIYGNDTIYRHLVQGVSDFAIYLLDPDGHVLNWNSGAERTKGYTAVEIVGRHFSCFYTLEDSAAGLPLANLRTALTTGKFEGEGWRLRKDGSRIWAHVVINSVLDEHGIHLGFAKITRDRTDQRQQAEELRLTRHNIDTALNNMSEGLCLFSAEEQVILYNQRFSHILGIDPTAIRPGVSLRSFLTLRQEACTEPHELGYAVEQELAAFRTHVRTPGVVVSTERVWSGRTIATNINRLHEGGWVMTVQDITEKKRIERQIVHLALYDALTELHNRSSFNEQCESRIQADIPCALLYLDLDRFKPINDTLGHAAGDRVLQTVAERIRGQLRKQDAGARLGGDEFAVLLSGCDSVKAAETVANRLLLEIQRPIHCGPATITVSASVGIALAPQHGTSTIDFHRNADFALYNAKEAGRGCFRLFDDSLQVTFQQRRSLERDLRLALSNNELSLHYQPVVDLQRNVVTSFEALLRWQSPTRGNVSPGEFIPFAEEVGIMPELGDWVLRTACAEAASWGNSICISVNLSPTQFRLPNLVERVSVALADSGLAPERLELEITETAMIGDLPGARAILNELRSMGIQIAMDDFGTGYSSLSFLRTLPFTRIKIDRSFVQDLDTKPEAVAIIRAVTGLCLGLGVSATAEGVETERQLEILREEGCGEVQGYLIQRPAEARAAAAWLAFYNEETAKNAILATAA